MAGGATRLTRCWKAWPGHWDWARASGHRGFLLSAEKNDAKLNRGLKMSPRNGCRRENLGPHPNLGSLVQVMLENIF